MKRYFSIPFQIGFLCMALFLFHLSLSDGLFAWLFPDEIYASNCYNQLGLLACSKSYYLTTTINRISAGFSVCLMAKIVTWFHTPYMGWVSARWIFYLLIPMAMALFFQSILRLPLKLGFIIALMISAVGLFVMFAFPIRSADITSFEDALFTPFGLDLASYATATFTFLMLFALFPKSIQNRFFFALFSLFYFLNLSSHEVFLVISAIFLPLYGGCRYTLLNHAQPTSGVIKYLTQDKRLFILISIYILSAVIVIFAPSVNVRLHGWPPTGSLKHALWYTILSVEEVIFVISKYYFLAILVFLLGMIARLLTIKKTHQQHHIHLQEKLLYACLLSAPFLYLFLMSFLLGLTPSLQVESIRSDAFRILEHFINPLTAYKYAGLAVRQNLFLYIYLFLDVFLIGFLLGRCLKHKNTFTLTLSRKQEGGDVVIQYLYKAFLFFILSILFLFHPDGLGGLHILSTLAKNDIDFINHTSQAYKKIKIGPIIHSLYPQSPIVQYSSQLIFPRKRLGIPQSAITNIEINRYFKKNRHHPINLTAIDYIHQQMPPLCRACHVSKTHPWVEQIYALYKTQ